MSKTQKFIDELSAALAEERYKRLEMETDFSYGKLSGIELAQEIVQGLIEKNKITLGVKS